MIKVYLKVIPCSSFRKLEYCKDGTVKAYLHSAPEKGNANSELIEYLSKIMGVPKSSVVIEKGQSSRRKLVSISGVTKAEFNRVIN